MDQPEKGSAKRASGSSKPKIVFGEALGALEESIRRAIALRAYDLYQTRGRDHGNDMQDWFGAENELIKPASVTIEDSGTELAVRAGVDGFTAADFQIGVSPRRLIIWARAARAGTPGGAMHLLGEIDLPTAVEPAKTSATVSDGVFQWQAAKAKSGVS